MTAGNIDREILGSTDLCVVDGLEQRTEERDKRGSVELGPRRVYKTEEALVLVHVSYCVMLVMSGRQTKTEDQGHFYSESLQLAM